MSCSSGTQSWEQPQREIQHMLRSWLTSLIPNDMLYMKTHTPDLLEPNRYFCWVSSILLIISSAWISSNLSIAQLPFYISPFMVKEVTKAKVLSVERTSQHKKYCPDIFMCHKSLTFWVKFKEDHSPFNLYVTQNSLLNKPYI